MNVIAPAILSLVIGIAASTASAASAQLDWPDCASLTTQQLGPASFALSCNAGPVASVPRITLDYPQCSAVSVWGEGDAIRIDCVVNGQLVAAGSGSPVQMQLSGCPGISVWGSGSVASINCVLDVAQQRVQEAYVAYYGRPADPAGLAYWTSQLAAAGGSLVPIIDAFGTSPEFVARYGGLAATALVTAVYRQTLGHDPDSDGLAWYVARLNSGTSSLGTIALNVLDGAVTRPDATVAANRIHVANYYTKRVAGGCAYGSPTHGFDLLAPITAQQDSVNAAIAAIDAICGS
jgi:hypothetical protein